MQRQNLRSRTSPHKRFGKSFEDHPSKAKQAFAEEADINNIMHRYVETGKLPATHEGFTFGDFTLASDLQDALQQIDKAYEDFDSLPAKVRDRFKNDPYELIQFVTDPANEGEAREIGLLPMLPPTPPAPAEPAAAPAAEPSSAPEPAATS